MKLDRNANPDGANKYALIKMRRLHEIKANADGPQATARQIIERCRVNEALEILEKAGVIDYGNTVDSEFFVIRLKDRYAPSALHAYAVHAGNDDPEYAREVMEMCHRSGNSHPNCKRPD